MNRRPPCKTVWTTTGRRQGVDSVATLLGPRNERVSHGGIKGKGLRQSSSRLGTSMNSMLKFATVCNPAAAYCHGRKRGKCQFSRCSASAVSVSPDSPEGRETRDSIARSVGRRPSFSDPSVLPVDRSSAARSRSRAEHGVTRNNRVAPTSGAIPLGVPPR